jgi:small subunit ribosomal protein S15
MFLLSFFGFTVRALCGKFLSVTNHDGIDDRRPAIVALAKDAKSEIIGQYKQHGTDTGSPSVQVALITKRINSLTEHFKTHTKDNHSRRGLLKLVSQRRHLLDYLRRNDADRYREVISSLGIRK